MFCDCWATKNKNIFTIRFKNYDMALTTELYDKFWPWLYFKPKLFWPFTVLTPYLIPNQLYQIFLRILKHLFCKIAKNTQPEPSWAKKYLHFSGSPDSVSNMASKRWMAKIAMLQTCFCKWSKNIQLLGKITESYIVGKENLV